MLRVENFRESFLKSATATALFVTFSAEILSLFHALAYLPLLACWCLYLAALVAYRYRSHKLRPHSLKGGGQVFGKGGVDLPQAVLLGLMACLVIVAGITALVAAPNNFDSLTYHLPRVMHWIQNRSVAHYPTNIDRQLVMAPFSEYMIMHLQILSGSDRFANCVQWFAMVGSVLGVSLIVRAFKGTVAAQIVAAAVAVSVPMGLLQASSTQNDYTVTFWLVCLVYFIVAGKGGSLRQAFWVGVTLALAIFTKGTAYFVAFPFMILYLWQLLRQETLADAEGEGREAAGAAPGNRLKQALLSLVIIGAAVLVVNGGHLARNYQTFGNPLAHGTGNEITCQRVDLTSLVSCVTRNLAVQLSTGLPGPNRALYGLTASLHRMIGADLNDPALTAGDEFIMLPALVRYHEDYAPNPLHMLLVMVSAGFLLVRWKKVPRQMLLFAAAGMAGFLLLSLFLKWTPYLSRYFIPFFVLSAPVVAFCSEAVRPRAVVYLLAGTLLCSSFFVLTGNFMRPLTGPRSIFVTPRLEQYFMARPEAISYFVSEGNMVKGQPNPNIGLSCNGNTLEYLLWVVLGDQGQHYRIEHVEVKGPSGRIPLKDFASYFPVSL
ncbi:MAG TPA: glycosyltransferase family 39 protein [Geomonas sp.]|nr:glycosyltransferase family 39 protein [Geomonas sp.]